MGDKFIIAIVIVFGLLSFRCSGVRHHKSSQEDAKQTCFSGLGEDAVVVPSPDSTYILCLKEIEMDKMMPESTFDYSIIKRDPGKVVYEGKVMSGKITWYSDEEVLITEKLGILGVRKRNVRTYRINVRTGRITETGDHEQL